MNFFVKRVRGLKVSKKLRIGFIFGAILGITLFHYSIGVNPLNHQIYGKFYYVPILLSALWFGIRGGILTLIIIDLLFLPHFFIDWGNSIGGLWGILLEIPTINLAGLVTGYLKEKEKEKGSALSKMGHLASLGEASSLIAHELKNIGISIVGVARLINRKANLPEETMRMLGMIEKESQRMERLARDILFFSHNAPLKKERVDLGQFVEEILSTSKGVAEEKGVNFCCEVMEDIPSMELDQDRMKEVLVNLIQNAVHVTPPGGTVHVKVLRNQGDVWIQITDTGCGIPRENLDKIFLPFFTTKTGGHGLGLTISKKTVEAHGAILEVDSRVGSGTQFKIVFPT